MTPEKWYLKELKIVDPTYFPVWNDLYQYWEIKKRMEILRKDKDNGVVHQLKDPTVAIFETLSMRSIENLKERKANGRKYADNTKGWYQQIKRDNRAAQKKGREIARDRIAREMLDAYRMSKRTTFA